MESTQQSCSFAPVLIRAACRDDLKGLADVLAHSFYSKRGLFRWLFALFRLGIYEDLKYRLNSDKSHYICVVAVQPLDERTSQVIGGVELSLRRRELWQSGDEYPYLSNLAVHPDYRNRGVAQQLLKACETFALEWGCGGLYLHVLEDNDRARRLYEKAGYRIKRLEPSLWSWLLERPRQILLHKAIARS